MFDSRDSVYTGQLTPDELAYYTDRAAHLDDVVVSEDDVDASQRPDAWVPTDDELEALIAADPAAQTGPTAAQVVAEAEHAPVTGGLVCRLAQVDPASLDADGQVGLAVAWSRVRNSADARVVDAVASLAAGGDGADPWDPASFTWAEVGAALRLGDGAATGLVHSARTLTAELPATLDAMRIGQVSRQKADVLVELTAGLTAEQRADVETATLAKAADRTPAQHRAAVRRMVDRIDPDALDRRRAKARADIRLVRAHLGDGMGELFASLPSEDLDIIWEAADTW
ncbi:MAG: DUF222 domain-containing protein, partial [Frankiales bacterium]|nr:DUF222 domain-containing protein [Frankiales bacterium]